MLHRQSEKKHLNMLSIGFSAMQPLKAKIPESRTWQ